jgi:hypothetical protein
MKGVRLKWGIGAAYLAVSMTMASPALPSYKKQHDPDWPCIQRKVPELSLAQVWNGPELPQSARDWRKNADIDELVQEVAARRVPIPEAQREIRDFAAGLPEDKRHEQLLILVQGMFDHMNAERSQIISGIGRYARKQIELAATLRKETSEVDAMRTKPDADLKEVDLRTQQLGMQTRIFEERAQSLTYVCEVPTIIEQRLYQLAKTIAEVLPEK